MNYANLMKPLEYTLYGGLDGFTKESAGLKTPLWFDTFDEFYEAYKNQWYLENKSFGFEVQDARIGGLIRRVHHCKEILMDYLAGKITKIDELEEIQLDFEGNGENFSKKHLTYGYWDRIITANIV